MDGRVLKARWREGEPTVGMWLRLADPTVADLVADVGFDWVVFDAEHVAFDLQTLQSLMIALKGSATVPLVRVPANDPVFIQRMLDMGAGGVIVPRISTGDEARSAVAACKYPPVGIRGTGPRRPGRYGRLEREYIAMANEQTIVLVMIETTGAVSNIEEILTVKGLDAIILGPVDLAASLGFLGDFEHPQVQAMIDSVIERVRALGIPFGDGRPTDRPHEWLARGAQLIAVGDDEWFIRTGAFAALEAFRRAVGSGGNLVAPS